MENYSFMVELASLIIIGGFVGTTVVIIQDAVKSFIRKRREKKQK